MNNKYLLLIKMSKNYCRNTIMLLWTTALLITAAAVASLPSSAFAFQGSVPSRVVRHAINHRSTDTTSLCAKNILIAFGTIEQPTFYIIGSPPPPFHNRIVICCSIIMFLTTALYIVFLFVSLTIQYFLFYYDPLQHPHYILLYYRRIREQRSISRTVYQNRQVLHWHRPSPSPRRGRHQRPQNWQHSRPDLSLPARHGWHDELEDSQEITSDWRWSFPTNETPTEATESGVRAGGQTVPNWV